MSTPIDLNKPINPYAPPTADLATPGDGGTDAWRQGRKLILRHGGQLPHRCVKCNAPAVTPIKQRKVYWHHPAVYLAFLLNILIYIIVALIVRKSAKVAPGLCPAHQRRRTVGLLIGWIGVPLTLVAFIGGAAGDAPLVAVAGLVGLLAAIIAALILARIVIPSRIDKEYATLKGCGDAFLDSLPVFPG